jgi:hypothetical protein
VREDPRERWCADAWESIEKNALWALEQAADSSSRDTLEGMARR